MPLIKCPDCSTEVSDAAVTCPKCSRPIAVKKQGPAKKVFVSMVRIIGVVVLLIVLVVAGFLIYADTHGHPIEVKQLIPSSPPVPVKLARRQAVLANGWVYQFQNSSGQSLRYTVTFKNGAASKSFSIVSDPGVVKEIGGLEGWSGAKGDNVKIESTGFSSVALKF